VYLEQRAGLVIERALEVAQVRSVRGADLAQPAAGGFHYLGDTEGAADLDQLAARDDDFLAARYGIQCEKDRGRVVVDDRGGFRAGQPAQQGLHMRVAFPAPRFAEVELERAGVRHCGRGRFGGPWRQKCAAQVRVQHGAAEVEHAPQGRPARCLDADDELLDDPGFVAGFARLAVALEQRADLGRHEAMAVRRHAGLHARRPKDAIDRGNGSEAHPVGPTGVERHGTARGVCACNRISACTYNPAAWTSGSCATSCASSTSAACRRPRRTSTSPSRR
jgi:hypothetical protein